MLTGTLPWYVARACGLTAWALLTASVVWGLILSTKVFGMKPRPAWVQDLHRFLGGLAVIFVMIHVLAILADHYIRFTPVNVLVPLTAGWRPGAVSWGVVALYLLVAIEITSLLRHRLSKHRLSKKVWRTVHVASFPLYIAATTHAFMAGTDSTRGIVRPIAILCTIAVVALTSYRLVIGRRRPAAKQQRVRPVQAAR